MLCFIALLLCWQDIKLWDINTWNKLSLSCSFPVLTVSLEAAKKVIYLIIWTYKQQHFSPLVHYVRKEASEFGMYWNWVVSRISVYSYSIFSVVMLIWSSLSIFLFLFISLSVLSFCLTFSSPQRSFLLFSCWVCFYLPTSQCAFKKQITCNRVVVSFLNVKWTLPCQRIYNYVS